LVDSNDLLGAQTLILDELESQYGGAAEAAANWSDRLNLAFGNIKESIGEALTPAFERFVIFMIEKVIPPVQKFFDEDFPVMLQKFGAAGAGIAEAFGPIGKALREAFNIPEEMSMLEGLLDKIASIPDNPLFMELVNSIVKLTPALLQLLPPLTELVIKLIPLLIQATPLLIGLIDGLTKVFGFVAKEAETASFQTKDLNKEFADLAYVTVTNLPIIGSWVRIYNDIALAIFKAVDALGKWFQLLRENSGVRLPGVPALSIPPRAVGGSVATNRSYLVGERGPEIFTPGAGGFITPNNQMGGGGSMNITVNVNAGLGANGAQIGQEIVNLIRKSERSSGPVFASA
jgi:hypothetical protein